MLARKIKNKNSNIDHSKKTITTKYQTYQYESFDYKCEKIQKIIDKIYELKIYSMLDIDKLLRTSHNKNMLSKFREEFNMAIRNYIIIETKNDFAGNIKTIAQEVIKKNKEDKKVDFKLIIACIAITFEFSYDQFKQDRINFIMDCFIDEDNIECFVWFLCRCIARMDVKGSSIDILKSIKKKCAENNIEFVISTIHREYIERDDILKAYTSGILEFGSEIVINDKDNELRRELFKELLLCINQQTEAYECAHIFCMSVASIMVTNDFFYEESRQVFNNIFKDNLIYMFNDILKEEYGEVRLYTEILKLYNSVVTLNSYKWLKKMLNEWITVYVDKDDIDKVLQAVEQAENNVVDAEYIKQIKNFKIDLSNLKKIETAVKEEFFDSENLNLKIKNDFKELIKHKVKEIAEKKAELTRLNAKCQEIEIGNQEIEEKLEELENTIKSKPESKPEIMPVYLETKINKTLEKIGKYKKKIQDIEDYIKTKKKTAKENAILRQEIIINLQKQNTCMQEMVLVLSTDIDSIQNARFKNRVN